MNDQQIQDFLSDYNSRVNDDDLSADSILDLCRQVNNLKAGNPQALADVAFAVSRALVSTIGVTASQTMIACLNDIFGAGTFPPPGS